MLNDTESSPPRLSRRGAPYRRASAGNRWGILRAIVLGVLLAAVISAVLLVDLLPSNRVILEAGDVSREDILAPRDLSYDSELRTKQAQDAAAASVQEIFDPPDVPEFVKGGNRDPGLHSKGRDERTLNHQPRHVILRGEIQSHSGTDRTAMQNDPVRRDS